MFSYKGSEESNRAVRASQLLRYSEGEGVWGDSEDPEAAENAWNDFWGDKKIQLEDSERAKEGPASIYVSHVWETPLDWGRHFPTHTYPEIKGRQLEAACRRMAKRDLGDSALFPSQKLWLDKAAVPCEIQSDDHPRQKTSFGASSDKHYYTMTVRELWAIMKDAPADEDVVYTFVEVNEPRDFKEDMRIRPIDEYGKPSLNPEDDTQEWTITPGKYFIKQVGIADGKKSWTQHGVDPSQLVEPYIIGRGTVPQWLQSLTNVSEKLWLEVTLGSLRAENLSLIDEIIWKHPRMTVLLSWDHFARLWPLFEWATFLLRHSPTQIELACDLFAPLSTMPQHLDRVRRLSIQDACAKENIHDERDVEMLLGDMPELKELQFFQQKSAFGLRKQYRCESSENAQYQRSDTPRGTFERKGIWKTDFTTLEEFIKVTAIMVFARTTLRDHAYQSVEASLHWYTPWMHLANELGFHTLAAQLKAVKAVTWLNEARELAAKEFEDTKAAMEEAGDEDAEQEDMVENRAMHIYVERIDSWFEATCVEIYKEERNKAVRAQKGVGSANPSSQAAMSTTRTRTSRATRKTLGRRSESPSSPSRTPLSTPLEKQTRK